MAEGEEECSLSLAYRGLTEIPREYTPKLEGVRHLDLSYNNFSDLRSLYGLLDLTTLLLDSNEITSHTVFPPLPNLKILWVNKNQISNLSVFIETVALNFPELIQLSMMNNSAAPSFFNGGSKQDYEDYRQFVISQLPKLRCLDDTPISAEERETASRIYGGRRLTVQTLGRKQEAKDHKKRSSTLQPTSHRSGRHKRKQ